MTTDQSNHVYLSDGGHFENLGIYELARRRCRYIIACDAGCDPDYQFEDLGNAIRKCQIDLGVVIDIDPAAIRPQSGIARSTFHCALGRIHYPQGPSGYLLYLKTSLTGNESADVIEYAQQCPDFPHQTTADQWYSESQFESYRRLGVHVIEEVLAAVLDVPGSDAGGATFDLEEAFNALDKHWYRPSEYIGSFATHAEALEEIFELIRNDDQLRFLDAQIYPEWPRLMNADVQKPLPQAPIMLPQTAAEIRAGFYICNRLIQLMEKVYLDLHLEEEYAHPDNRGWMNLFRNWSWAGMLRVTWAISASMYGARFQRFCRRRLDLPVGRVVCDQKIAAENYGAIDSRLGFVEQDHIKRILKGFGEVYGDTEALWVVPISLSIKSPFGEQDPFEFSFPFGFAVIQSKVEQSGLIYFRVRDHLRGIGLGPIPFNGT